jgi:hypothetical protein
MDSLSGLLLIPPERAQILGRAAWKPRYVVVGPRSSLPSRETHSTANYSQLIAANRVAALQSPNQPINEDICIMLYKSKVR